MREVSGKRSYSKRKQIKKETNCCSSTRKADKQKDSIKDEPMKPKRLFVLYMLTLGVFFVCATAYAQDSGNNKPGYKLLTTISNIPGNLAGGFDISWVDSETGRYYLTTRGT